MVSGRVIISKTTAKINTVNGCSGDSAIVEMWKSHFEALFNSVDSKRDKELFMQCISQKKWDSNTCMINVRDIA